MKHIAQEQKYIFLIAPVRKGRNNRHSAGCDEGNAFPLLIQLIYLYLEKIAGGAAGAAVQGIGGIGGVFLKTGVSVATSATSTVATNAIQYAGDWDGFASSMSSFDTWSGVITSGAGALVTNCLGEMNLGTKVEKLTGKDGKTILNTIHTKVDGFNSSQIGSIQSFNSLAGGLASSALSYGLTGEATFNILNISDFGAGTSCGLLEVSVGNKGIKTRLGTGGTDISAGTLISSLSGIKNISVNEKIKKAAKDNNMAQSATALRMLYGFGDDKGLELLDDVLSKKTSLAVGDGTGNAQTVTENGKRIVYLNGYSDNMTKEEQMKLGITLSHESYRDGVVSDSLTQLLETRNAVAGHTDLMTGMLADDMYKSMMSRIIAGDTNLQMDLLARSLGDDVFNDYVDGMYDSSADYWRVTKDKDGNIIDVKDDGDYEHFNVYDEKGKKKGRFDNDGTSLTKQLAALGNGTQSKDDINYLMWHDFGMDYKDGKGWYAVDEKGVYTKTSFIDKLKDTAKQVADEVAGLSQSEKNKFENIISSQDVKEAVSYYQNIGGSHCDEYGTLLLDVSGRLPNNWPNPLSYKVATSDLNYWDYFEKNNMINSTPSKGINIMLMKTVDSQGNITGLTPHMAFTYVNNRNSIYLSHYTGGYQRTSYGWTQSELENNFNYNTFGYVSFGKIKKSRVKYK